MPINCLINFWTIREQFVFQTKSIRVSQTKSIRVSQTKTIRAPNKMKAALMKSFMSILGEERGKSAPKKNNNFERFFGDSTLTFLTFGNIYRLSILPTRRLVLLRGRERKIWGRQIKIRGRQILTGCAPNPTSTLIGRYYFAYHVVAFWKNPRGYYRFSGGGSEAWMW